jgi:hypothetical protein
MVKSSSFYDIFLSSQPSKAFFTGPVEYTTALLSHMNMCSLPLCDHVDRYVDTQSDSDIN